MEPYYELPLPITKLRSLIQFQGCHSLPVEQGLPGRLRLVCYGSCASALCALPVLGVMNVIMSSTVHMLLALGSRMRSCFEEASGAMKSLVWHKDRQAVCALLLAIVTQAQT